MNGPAALSEALASHARGTFLAECRRLGVKGRRGSPVDGIVSRWAAARFEFKGRHPGELAGVSSTMVTITGLDARGFPLWEIPSPAWLRKLEFDFDTGKIPRMEEA